MGKESVLSHSAEEQVPRDLGSGPEQYVGSISYRHWCLWQSRSLKFSFNLDFFKIWKNYSPDENWIYVSVCINSYLVLLTKHSNHRCDHFLVTVFKNGLFLNSFSTIAVCFMSPCSSEGERISVCSRNYYCLWRGKYLSVVSNGNGVRRTG